LVLDIWQKAHGQAFPQGPDSAFDWIERCAPDESVSEPLAAADFARACAATFGVERNTTLLLAASLVAGVAGRTLLMPNGGVDSIAWHVACVDRLGGHAAHMCRELLRPVEVAVARILQQAGDTRDRQTLAQMEFTAANRLEAGRKKLKQLKDSISAGRKALPALPPQVAAAEINTEMQGLTDEERRLQLELARVRLLRRQQLFCGLIGASEFKDRRAHGFDGALMEIVTGESLANRLATTEKRILETVRAWRDPSPVPRTLICHAGRMDTSPVLTSLWITSVRDLREVVRSPRLAALRLLDPFLLIEAGNEAGGAIMPDSRWAGWWAALAGVFEDRLIGRRHTFTTNELAKSVLIKWRRFLADRSFAETLRANPGVVHLPLQLAAVIRRLGDTRYVVRHEITGGDAELAIEVAEAAVKSTAGIGRKLRRAARHLTDAGDEDVDEILVKLARLGPSTLRMIARSFHRIRNKELCARLQKAVAAGLVVEEPGGLYILSSHHAGCRRVSASADSEP